MRLAESDLYAQQAFVVGRAYGLQFHLEVDSRLAAEWMEIPDYADELERLGGAGMPAAVLEQVAEIEPRSVPLARSLFGRWLSEVVGIGSEG